MRRRTLIKLVGVPVAVFLVMIMPCRLSAESAGSGVVLPGSGGAEAWPGPEIDSAVDTSRPVFLYFYLETCGACQSVKALVDELEEEYGERVRFTRIDIQEDAYTAQQYHVTVVPTVVLTYGGEFAGRREYQRFEGSVSKDTLQRSIDLWLTLDVEVRSVTEPTAVEDGPAVDLSLITTSEIEAPPALAAGLGTPASPGALEQVWKLAQAAGSYRFKADLEQTLRPRPVPDMIGQTSQRADIRVEGEVVLPGNAQLWLRSEGAGLEPLSLHVIQSGTDTFAEIDGELERIENPLAAAAPLTDYLGYLAAVVNVHELEPVETDGVQFTRYSFDIDAGRLATYLRGFLQAGLASGEAALASRMLNTMAGSGEIWVDPDGLPRRQVLDLTMPALTTEYDARSHVVVEFYDFGEVSTLPQAVYDSTHDTWSLEETSVTKALAGGDSGPGPVPPSSAGGPVPALVTSLVALCLVLALLWLHRSRAFQTTVCICLTVIVVAIPAMRADASRGGGTRQTYASPATPNEALGPRASSTPSPGSSVAASLTESGLRCGDGEPGVDTDGDGLDDRTENCLGTDPYDVDTDMDSIPDNAEVDGFVFMDSQGIQTTWPGDPLLADCNKDGLFDLYEWAESAGGTAASWDPDGDDVPNPWDPDNDNDGIPDSVDLSPFSVTDYSGEVAFTSENPNPDGSYQYISIQIQPEVEDHLRYTSTLFDWPDGDDRGNIQDLDYSRDDMRLVPVLEIEANTAPDADLARRYGVSTFPNTEGGPAYAHLMYVPLLPLRNADRVVGFETKVVYGPADQADIRWKVRVVCMVQATLDSATSTGISSTTTPVLVYPEGRFRLAGLLVTKSGKYERAILGTPSVPDDDKELFNMVFGLNASFLHSAQLDNQSPVNTVLAELKERLDSPNTPEHMLWGVKRDQATSRSVVEVDLPAQYAHEDAALADLANRTLLYLGSYSGTDTATLAIAYEHTSGALSMDGLDTTGQLHYNLSGIPLLTERGVSLQVFRRQDGEWVGLGLNVMLQVVDERHADISGTLGALQGTYPDLTEQDLRSVLRMFYTTWWLGRRSALKLGTMELLPVARSDEEMTAFLDRDLDLPSYLMDVSNLARPGAGLNVSQVLSVNREFFRSQEQSGEYTGLWERLSRDMLKGEIAGAVYVTPVVRTAWKVRTAVKSVWEARTAARGVSGLAGATTLSQAMKAWPKWTGYKNFFKNNKLGIAGTVAAVGVAWLAFGQSTDWDDPVAVKSEAVTATVATLFAVGLFVISLNPVGAVLVAALAVIDMVVLSSTGISIVGEIVSGVSKFLFRTDAMTKIEGVQFGGTTASFSQHNAPVDGLVVGSRMAVSDRFTGEIRWVAGWSRPTRLPGGAYGVYMDDASDQDDVLVTPANENAAWSQLNCQGGYPLMSCENDAGLIYEFLVARPNVALKPSVWVNTWTKHEECTLWVFCWTENDKEWLPDAPINLPPIYLDVLPATLDGFWAWDMTPYYPDHAFNPDWPLPALVDLFELDSDGDGLSDGDEKLAGTLLDNTDSDGDGLLDGEEVYHRDPATGQWDGGWEVDRVGGGRTRVFSDPLGQDADGDGLVDKSERDAGLSPYAFNDAPRLVLQQSPEVTTPRGDIGVYVQPGDVVTVDLELFNSSPDAIASTLEFCFPSEFAGYVGGDLSGDRLPQRQETSAAQCGSDPNGTRISWDFGGDDSLQPLESVSTTITLQIDPALSTSRLARVLVSLPHTSGAGPVVVEQSVDVHIDSEEPVVAFAAPADGTLLGGGIADYVLGGTASDSTTWVERVEVTLPAGVVVAAGTDEWAYTWALPVDGVYTLEARAFDFFGNASPGSSVRVTVDNTPPSVTVTSPAPGAVVSSAGDGEIQVPVSGTAVDALSGVSRVQISINDRPWQAVALNGADWSFDWRMPSADSAQGEHSVRVRAFDAANNVSAVTGSTVIVDVVPPTSELTDSRFTVDPPSFPVGSSVAIRGVANDAGSVPEPARPAELVGNLHAISDATIWLEPSSVRENDGGVGATWLGDFDGDRLADTAIGLPASEDGAGRVSIIYGRAGGWPVPPGEEAIASSPTSFVGLPGAGIGLGISAAGDVNGDGLDDLLIADAANNRVHLVFGDPGPLGTGRVLTGMPMPGLRTVLSLPSGYTLEAAEAAGDVNGDGIGDIFVTTGGAARQGHLVLGESFWLPEVDPVTRAAIALHVPDPDAFVRGVGDLDGDELDDFIMSVPGEDVYVFFGTETLLAHAQEPCSAGDGQAIQAGLPFPGATMATGLGDVNGDGLTDLALGDGGSVYICSGDGNRDTTCTEAVGPVADLTFVVGVGNVRDVAGEGLQDILVGSGTDALLYLGAESGLQYAATFTGVAMAASAPYAAGADLSADGSSDLLLVPDPAAAAEAGFRARGFGQPPAVDQSGLPHGGGAGRSGDGSGPGARQSPGTRATTLHVDDDGYCAGNSPCYTTMDAAISVASEGDTITVHPGVYSPFVVDKDNLTIAGVNPDAVFVDAGGADCAVRITGATGVTLADMTLRNTQRAIELHDAGVGGYDAPVWMTVLEGLLIHGFTANAVWMDRTSTVTLRRCTLAGQPNGEYIHIDDTPDPALVPQWTVLPDIEAARANGDGGDLHAGSDGTLYAVQGGGNDSIWKLAPGSTEWTLHTGAPVAVDSPGATAVDEDDNLWLLHDSDPTDGRMELRTYDGTSWSVSSPLQFTTDGLGLISYYDSTHNRLKVAHCADGDCGSATITTLDPSDHFGNRSSVAIGEDGLGLIAGSLDSDGHLRIAHCDNADCTGATITVVDTATVGYMPSVTIGTDGLGLIAYSGHRAMYGYALKVAHCDSVDCTSTTISTFLDRSQYIAFPSAAIGADELGLISFIRLDGSSYSLRVAHCENGECTSATVSTLDSRVDGGPYPSIAVGGDGVGLIAYSGRTGDPYVAHCDNADCTSATITRIDPGTSPAQYFSVAVGADGLALISYYDADNGDLKVAHCDNAACTSATITTLDSAGDVGQETSITIGKDRLGLIGYVDATDRHLKVAHCQNAACTSATITTVDAGGSVAVDTSNTSIAARQPGVPGHSVLVSAGNGVLYAVPGGDGRLFRLEGGWWSDPGELAGLPVSTGQGADAVWVNGAIYLLPGVDHPRDFYRYDPGPDSWTSLASTPEGPGYFVGTGASMAWDGGDYLYALAGGLGAGFVRYSISGDAWETLPDAPDSVRAGAGLVLAGDELFALQGGALTGFWKFGPIGSPPEKLVLDRVVFATSPDAASRDWTNIDPAAPPEDFGIRDEGNNVWVGGTDPVTIWSPGPSTIPLSIEDAAFLDPSRGIYRLTADSPFGAGYHAHVPDATVSTTGCPGCFAGVQDAIDSGTNRVVVESGNYAESIYLVTGVSVVGSGAASTVLSGSGGSALVSAEGVVGASLSGFTLAGNGGNNGLSVEGGAQYVAFSRNAVRDTVTAIAVDGANTGLEVFNNTIVSNVGGMAATNNAAVDVRNTIFAYNSGTGLSYQPAASSRLHKYNLYWANGSDMSPDEPGAGELFLDPLFLNLAANDYRTLDASPVIDAGDPGDPAPPGTGSRADIGYLEQGRASYYADDGYCASCPNDGLTWGVDAFDTIQAALDAAVGGIRLLDAALVESRFTVGVAPGTYHESVDVPSHVSLVGSGADRTTIEAAAGPAVTFAGVVQASISSFTITGSGEAGVSAAGASNHILVSRNLIRGNGDGVRFSEGATGEVLFNTVVDSSAANLVSSGSRTWVVVRNNILADSPTGLQTEDGGQVFNSYNLLDNTTNYVDDAGTGLSHQVDTEIAGESPAFAESVLYRLTVDSPAVDMADPTEPVPVGGGESADLGYSELRCAPVVLFLGEEDVSRAAKSSGIVDVEYGVVHVDDPDLPVEDTVPGTWVQAATGGAAGDTVRYWWADYTPVQEGLYRVYSRAYDEVSNTETDVDLLYGGAFLADGTPPVVTWLAPAGTISSPVELRAEVSDFLGGDFHVERVYFEVDGAYQPAEWASDPWDSVSGQPRVFRAWVAIQNGPAVVQAFAVDRAGNTGQSAPVGLDISGQDPLDAVSPPILIVDAPAPGDSVQGVEPVEFRGSAADDGGGSGIAAVEVSTDGGFTWMPAILTGQDGWELDWNAPRGEEFVSYPVRVRATDNAGNATQVEFSVTVDNRPPTGLEPVTYSISPGEHVSLGDTLTIGWQSPVDGSGYAAVFLAVDQSEDTVPSSEVGGNILDYVLDQVGAWYVHVAAKDDSGNTVIVHEGPWFVSDTINPEPSQRQRHVVLDSTVDLAHHEWDDSTERLGDDERGPGRQALYAAWDADSFYLAWQGAHWEIDGTLWAYIGVDSGGTGQTIGGLGSLPFSATYAVEVIDPTTGTLWEYDGASWVAVGLLDFAHGDSGGTEIRVPFGTDQHNADISLLAFAVRDTGEVWSVFPTTNPLGAEWTESFHWAGLDLAAAAPNAGQPDAVSVDMTATSPQQGQAAWGPGDPLSYSVTVTNREYEALSGLQLVFDATEGLTYQSQTGAEACTNCVPGEATWEMTLPALAPGASHTVTLNAEVGPAGTIAPLEDVATTVVLGLHGSSVAQRTYSHRVDGSPPMLTVFHKPNETIGPGVQTISGSTDDGDGAGTALVEWRVAGGDTWSTADGTLLWTVEEVDVPAPEVESTFEVELRATDLLGNTSEVALVSYTVDGTPPQLEFTMADMPEVVTGNYLSIFGRTSDDSGVRQVEVRVDGGVWQSVSSLYAADPEDVAGNWQDWVFTWSLPPDDYGKHTIEAQATSEVGNVSGPVSLQIVVDTVAPALTVVQLLSEVSPIAYLGLPDKPQGPAILSGTVSDGGGIGQVQVTVMPPEGGLGRDVQAVEPAPDGSWEYTPSLLRLTGQYTLTVSTVDAVGNESGPQQFYLEAVNAVPTADAGDAYHSEEGSVVVLDASGSHDADELDDIVLYEWDIDDDGQYDDAVGATCQHTFTDDGAFPIALRVTDIVGEHGTDTTVATIENVAPAVDAGPDQRFGALSVALPAVAFTDPGAADTHTASIYWGDGRSSPGVVTQDAGSGTVSGAHVYSSPGTYTIAVTVTDDDLGVGQDTLTIDVSQVTPPVEETPEEPAGDEFFGVPVPTVSTEAGVLVEALELVSPGEEFRLEVAEGTRALDEEGAPLSAIVVETVPTPPEPPAGSHVVGLAFDLGPDGATFDPPATIVVTYDPAQLPADVAEDDLVFAYYDSQRGWIELPSVVNTETRTVTALVGHFTQFAILSRAHATFTVGSLVVEPGQVGMGQDVAIRVRVTNTGAVEGTCLLTLTIDGTVDESREVTLAGGESKTLTFTASRTEAGTYCVEVNRLSSSFEVLAPEAPSPQVPLPETPSPTDLSLGGLAVTPSEAGAGESVTISLRVTNDGDMEGSLTVILRIDGVVEAAEEVTLPGGNSTTLTFTTARYASGLYSVGIGELVSSFTVVPTEALPPAPVNWWLIGGGVAAVVLLGLAGVLVLRLRKPRRPLPGMRQVRR